MLSLSQKYRAYLSLWPVRPSPRLICHGFIHSTHITNPVITHMPKRLRYWKSVIPTGGLWPKNGLLMGLCMCNYAYLGQKKGSSMLKSQEKSFTYILLMLSNAVCPVEEHFKVLLKSFHIQSAVWITIHCGLILKTTFHFCINNLVLVSCLWLMSNVKSESLDRTL